MWGTASVGGEGGWGRDEGSLILLRVSLVTSLPAVGMVAGCFCCGFSKSLFDYGPQFLGRKGNLQSKQYCFNKINKN
jgi:hypothetical protein